MKKEYGVYAAVLVGLILLGGGIWWMSANQAPATPADTVATSTGSVSTTTSSASTSISVQISPSSVTQKPASTPSASTAAKPVFSLVPGDEPATWYFVGAYSDGGEFEARATSVIQQMKNLLNAGASNKYELYVSIANQYELLGDGKQEYTYLNYALAVDSTKTGLAWHNMGKLLEKLGAYKSARIAYDRMAQVQSIRQFLSVRLEFLKAHAPEDTDGIKKAEADLAASTW